MKGYLLLLDIGWCGVVPREMNVVKVLGINAYTGIQTNMKTE